MLTTQFIMTKAICRIKVKNTLDAIVIEISDVAISLAENSAMLERATL